MKLSPLELEGVYLIEPTRLEDHRGYFARTFCIETFRGAGLNTSFPQHNISFNALKGTVRGMHYQKDPHEEIKVVRCISGAIDDVIVDIRPDSPTYRRSVCVELSEANGMALYIPAGFAHGFQTLTDETGLYYLMGTEFHPESATGFPWDDASFEIEWRLPISTISDKDKNLPAFEY